MADQEKANQTVALGSGLSAGLGRSDSQCPRCLKFVNGPKTGDGCKHCGHINGRSAEVRYRYALEYIKGRTGFWSIQEDEDLRPALEDCLRVVNETLATA